MLIKIGAGNTNQIAASSDGEDIPAGTRVVVAEIKDGVLYVFRSGQQPLELIWAKRIMRAIMLLMTHLGVIFYAHG